MFNTPSARHVTRTPGDAATSQTRNTSMGSPSSPRVDGTKPQSNGNTRPAGSGRDTPIASQRGSYFSLSAEPRGDSTTTWKLSPLAKAGTVSRFTLAHTAPVD